LPAKKRVYTVPDDGDPKTTHTIKLLPSSSAGVDEIGLKLAVLGVKVPGGASLLLDEARRIGLGQPRGPVAASFDDDDNYDPHSLDLVDDEVWRQIGKPTAGGYVSQYLRSFDDPHGPELNDKDDHRSLAPVIVAGIIGAIGAAVVAILPIVLPAVLDAGRRFIDAIKSGVDPVTAVGDVLAGKDPAAEKAAAEAAVVEENDKRTKLLIAGGAAVVVIGLIIYIKKRKAA